MITHGLMIFNSFYKTFKQLEIIICGILGELI